MRLCADWEVGGVLYTTQTRYEAVCRLGGGGGVHTTDCRYEAMCREGGRGEETIQTVDMRLCAEGRGGRHTIQTVDMILCEGGWGGDTIQTRYEGGDGGGDTHHIL